MVGKIINFDENIKAMAKINFIVKSKKEGQPATIYLRYSDKRGIDFIIATKEKVFPEYWSNITQSFKQRIVFNGLFSEKQKVEIEDRLTEIKAFINQQYFKDGALTKDWLKLTLDRYYEKGIKKGENLIQYIEKYITDAGTGARLNNAKRVYALSTVKSLRSMQSELNKFQAEKNKNLNFNDINIDFYNEWLAWFNKKSYSPNTIGKHLKSLKAILRQAREEGLHNNQEIERKAFKVISSRVDNIYLTGAEVDKLYQVDLSDKKHYELARDVFLIGVYTAQRFSDYSRIGPSNLHVIDGKKVIELIQRKTGERCIIPVRPELDAILMKYNYQVPNVWEQKVNSYIKIIASDAGITEKIEVERVRGGLKVCTLVRKCDLIKTHTARRTGCSLMYLAGIPTIDIMKLSGHKTEREFLKYINITKEQTAVSLSKHPYFIGKPLKVVK